MVLTFLFSGSVIVGSTGPFQDAGGAPAGMLAGEGKRADNAPRVLLKPKAGREDWGFPRSLGEGVGSDSDLHRPAKIRTIYHSDLQESESRLHDLPWGGSRKRTR